MRLQRIHGNRYVQRALSTSIGDGTIQRQDEEELGAGSLGLEEELVGHPSMGQTPSLQREGEVETDEEESDEASPTATITLQSNTPNISRPSQATIEANHDGTNIAGWTTPRDNIAVLSRTASTISIRITLDFDMELASEYTGDRLNVLRDHENHHPTIANNVAQEYLVDNLRTTLEALPDFTNEAPIQAAFQSAHSDFVTNERSDAQDYDNADYSRMEEAYYGVRTPLADLASGTPTVQAMVTAIDNFNSGATATPAVEEEAPAAETSEPSGEVPEGEGGSTDDAESSRIIDLAQPVIDAQSGLAQVDIDRLQYNPEFKGKVSTASGHIATLNGRPLNEAARTKLSELQTTLNGFTWTPPA